MNEKLLTLILVALTVLAVVFLPGAPIAAVEIITLKLMCVAFLLLIVFALVYFLRGTHYDIFEEVFDHENIAAAMFVSALMVSIALVIGK